MTAAPLRIAIAGGGYTGAMLIRHLCDRTDRPLDITVFEPRARLGRGVAYDVSQPHLLLNVPTIRMMPWLDHPSRFHDWAVGPGGWDPGQAEPDGGIYTTRALWGDFTAHLLRQGIENARAPVRLTHIRSDLTGLARGGETLRLSASDGRMVEAEALALALGNPDPRPLEGISDTGKGAPDPVEKVWAPDWMDAIDPDAPIGIVGTGLTAADMISGLAARGHRGPILALSRRGLVPHVMHNTIVSLDRARTDSYPTEASDLVHVVRARFEAAIRERGDWRYAIDRVRIDIPVLWRAMDVAARRRLMRWARPFWDIHRFRMPPPTWRAVKAMRETGQLRIVSGRLTALKDGGMQWTNAEGAGSFACAVVLNCTGPDYSYEGRCASLLDDLFRSGLLASRRVGEGFPVDATDRLIGRDQDSGPPVFALGACARMRYGELTTATEISAQTAAVARTVLAPD